MELKNVFNWEHFLVYLSGPIDFDANANKWRDDWTEKLINIGFKPKQILNPCRKPLIGASFNLDNEGDIIKKHRDKKEWSELCGMMSQIAHIDLRMVDKSDLVLVYFPAQGDYRVPTYGTIHEIVEARRQRKPVMVVWDGGKESCSAWIMWLVGHKNVFGKVDNMITRLENISKGQAAYNARDWLLLDLAENVEENDV